MTEWIITCNLKYYDINGAFRKFSKIDWKQRNNINVGDIVYIYITKPYSSIMYKCLANKVNLPSVGINDSEFNLEGSGYGDYGRYMELEFLSKYDKNQFPMDILMKNGLKTVRGPSKVTPKLSKYILKVLNNKNSKKQIESYEKELDKKLLEEIEESFNDEEFESDYIAIPEVKKEPIERNNIILYKRDKMV